MWAQRILADVEVDSYVKVQAAARREAHQKKEAETMTTYRIWRPLPSSAEHLTLLSCCLVAYRDSTAWSPGLEFMGYGCEGVLRCRTRLKEGELR